MISVVKKDPLRFPRYIALLFVTEFIRGNSAKRRRFFYRIFSRLAPKLGLFGAAKYGYTFFNILISIFKPKKIRRHVWRNREWLWAIRGFDNRNYLYSWLGARYSSGPKIIVIGKGSVGDIIQITSVLKALRDKLPMAQICLLHHSPAAKMVLHGNKNIDSIAHAELYHLEQIKRAVKIEGVADVALEIPSILYTITYTLAPKRLRHPEFDRLMPDEFFANAAAALKPWREPPSLPPPGSPFQWPDKWSNLQFQDVFGLTGHLPIDRMSDLEFHIEPADHAILDRLPPSQRFVTIQNGVDIDVMNWARAIRRRPTKLLPLETWKQIVRLLREQGVAVIQIGLKDDELIEGISLDFRGSTTLREAAVLMQHAICHVGTEGGLAHLAAAIHAKAVVLFGPSDATYVGYSQNINLTAGNCAGCCWVHEWSIYCPRGFIEPECMHAHKPETVVQAVLSLTGPQDSTDHSIAAHMDNNRKD